MTPYRQVRAVYNDRTIRVYQAYADPIADAALANGTFCDPFKMSRMTWIKPSFLWMMYRCGWAQKEGQNRVLGIDISREGFEWALSHGCLSHYEHNVHTSEEDWKATKEASPVRVQWDPERTITLDKEEFRSIQIGLSSEAIKRYVNEWIQNVEEVTDLSKKIHSKVSMGDILEANAMLPKESVYSLPKSIAAKLAASV